MAIKVDVKACQEALDLVTRYGTSHSAAKATGIPQGTLHRRVEIAVKMGLKPNTKSDTLPVEVELRAKVRDLQAQIASFHRETLDDRYVRERIIKLSSSTTEIPGWVIKPDKKAYEHGVPTLFASDWHWGEIVHPGQVNGVNEYNLAIAQDRAKRMVERTINLLHKTLVNPVYPGIVFALGGDMVSGDIHEELQATNEVEIMPTVLDLWGVLAWCIERLAEAFGKVFVPCVSGNHGRNTHKIRAKGRNFTSFDWLLYNFLAKRFESDKRITFFTPDGPDAYYRVYNHRYLLTHGDQFRGGDGMIGALGPIIRGDHKKRSRNGQIDMEYDTMILGHWHQDIFLKRLIVNSSLKGYDEYAYSNNFGFEPPSQQLWLTHPEKGITIHMPVLVDPEEREIETEWVSWAGGHQTEYGVPSRARS